MTEAEWNACNDPRLMLEFLRGKASRRKLMLFCVGCCRSLWHLLPLKGSRDMVEVVEMYADRTADHDDVQRASRQAWEASGRVRHPGKSNAARAVRELDSFVTMFSTDIQDVAKVFSNVATAAVEGSEQSRILRCVFGVLPLHAFVLESRCLTSTVTLLAQAIYTDRAFDRLPILADALEDAGCTNQDILAHCRGSGPHVRGCWVVDLLTGRS